MTGRVLPFDPSEHAAADTLLPFYVNGTLRGEELAFVERHVRVCEECQREVEWLRTVYAACAAVPLLQDPGQAPDDPARESDDRSLHSGWRARLRRDWRKTPSWTQWLVAAQLAGIVVLAGLAAFEMRGEASYRTLGAPNPSAQVRDAIAVMFDPQTTESDMRRLVLGIGARIVDGPSSTDVFVLEIPAQETDRALALLRNERGVRLAERLGPRTER